MSDWLLPLGPFDHLPQRDADTGGAAQERAMSESVGGYGGIKTAEWQGSDGSWTRLRTRNGWPVFEEDRNAVHKAQEPCLQGPLWEKPTGPGVPVDMFTLRLRYGNSPLQSTDGLFQVDRQRLKKWSAFKFDSSLIEVFFSSPSTSAAATPKTSGADQIVEAGWSTRTWHPKQIAVNVNPGLPVLAFSVARLNSLDLSYNSGNKFTWSFSKEGDTAATGSTPACMNRNGLEAGLSTRLFYTKAQLQQSTLILLGKSADLKMAPPGGFLGAVDRDPSDAHSPVQLTSLTGYDITNFSEADSCGQPWHGWMSPTSIVTDIGVTTTPNNYVFVSSTSDAPYETHYFSATNLPDIPPGLPSEMPAAGMQFLKDCVLFGRSRRITPVSSYSLGWNLWPAVKNESHIRILRLGMASDSGHYYLTVFDEGELSLYGLSGTSAQIGSTITVTLPLAMVGISSNVPTGGVINDDINAGTAAAKYHYAPLNTSPDGRKFIFSVYYKYPPVTIRLAYELTISSDVSSVSAALVFDYYQNPHSLTVDMFISTNQTWEYQYSSAYYDWYRGHVTGYAVDTPANKQLCDVQCIACAYGADGQLLVTTIRKSAYFDSSNLPSFSYTAPSLQSFARGSQIVTNGYLCAKLICYANRVAVYKNESLLSEWVSTPNILGNTYQRYVSMSSSVYDPSVGPRPTCPSLGWTIPFGYVGSTGNIPLNDSAGVKSAEAVLSSNNCVVLVISHPDAQNRAVDGIFAISPEGIFDASNVEGAKLHFPASLYAKIKGVFEHTILPASSDYTIGFAAYNPRSGKTVYSESPDVGYV